MKTNAPLFSIIVPVYNVAPYLRESLESVLAQTFTDWECVCIDDGSTDGSGEILDAYAQKDKRFRVLHKQNGGVSSARNLALENVRGAYVTFLDGDDLLLPEWLEKAADAVSASQPDLIRQDYKVLYENGCRLLRTSVRPGRYTGAEAILKWGPQTFIRDGYLWLLFIKRSLLQGLTFHAQLKVKEDCIFDLELLLRLQTVVQTDYAGYLYRYREGSAVNNRHAPEVFSHFIDASLAFSQAHRATFIAHGAGEALRDALGYSTTLDLIEWAEYYGEDAHAWDRIRHYHTALRQEEAFTLKHLHIHWRWAYWIYLKTQTVWPIRLLKRITRWRLQRAIAKARRRTQSVRGAQSLWAI